LLFLVFLFQYFRCFGWMLDLSEEWSAPPAFQYFRCFGWININLLKQIKAYLFQYFRCFGWMIKNHVIVI